MDRGNLMTRLIKEAIDNCKKKLVEIIKREKKLRNPSITVVFCPEKHVKEIYLLYIAMLKQLKQENPSWNYELVNAEKLLFDILKEFEYIDGEKFASKCERELLAGDLENSVREELVNTIQNRIQNLIKDKLDGPPPFLIILNMHACYNFIKTGNLIAQIHPIGSKALVLILYLQKERGQDSQKEVIKEANYNVDMCYLFENI